MGFPRWLRRERICLQCRDVGLILGREDPLEKGMAAHSSIPAWEIPRTRSLAGYSTWVAKTQGCTWLSA